MRGKRLLVIELLAVCAAMSFAGCGAQWRGEEDGSQTVNKTQTQLYVQNFKGGFGSEWLTAAAKRFEELYKDEHFEDGKTGVQIMISPAKVDGITLLSSINASSSEVFFNESVYYYDYLAKDALLDITDALTTPLSEYGETESIVDKMTKEQIAYYKADGKYYGIPHYAGYNGIMFDKDTFDDYNLYFKYTTDGTSVLVDAPSDALSAGPDGKLNTSDDGFPATYDEFFMLCDRMVEVGVTPFVWAGQYYDTYIEKVMYALCVDHDGLDETMLNFTFEGTANKLISEVASDGTYARLDATSISEANGYDLWRSEGKYLSMKFFEKIVKNNKYYAKNSFSPAHFYTEAQKDFLESRPLGNPIAMIMEGCWWENEAKDVIDEYGQRYGAEYKRENRHFGIMPLPKATKEDVGKQSTIVDTHYSLGFVKKSIAPAKIDLAKKFLRFVCTDESLAEFTKYTNTVKALDYEMSAEDLSSLSYYGKSVYELHKSSEIVYPYSTKDIYLDNQSALSVHNSYKSSVGNSDKAHPISYMREAVSNNAAEFFNGMYVYEKRNWQNLYGEYFD